MTPLPLLKTGFATFGSLHKLPKLHSKVIDLWSTLLLAVPDSRLLLVRDRLRGRRGQEILDSFEANGVAQGRVEVRHDWNSKNHWNHYDSIDLALDSFPWSGNNTACESLWMGVPVVTLISDPRSSRLAAGVLNSLDLADLIAESPEQYIERTSRWIGDPVRLAKYRGQFRGLMQASRLCDGRAFTSDLESA